MASKVKNNLTKLAKAKGFSHRDIIRAAEDLGFRDITYSKLSYWAANKNQPRLSSAFRLCSILECEFAEFFREVKGNKRRLRQ